MPAKHFGSISGKAIYRESSWCDDKSKIGKSKALSASISEWDAKSNKQDLKEALRYRLKEKAGDCYELDSWSYQYRITTITTFYYGSASTNAKYEKSYYCTDESLIDTSKEFRTSIDEYQAVKSKEEAKRTLREKLHEKLGDCWKPARYYGISYDLQETTRRSDPY